MESELTLRIVLELPPEGVVFGLQKGRGSAYQTIQKQRSSKGKDLRFEFNVEAKAGGSKATPNFGGPFVQGPPDQRFVYLDIGTYAGQTDTPWSRRLKIPLSGISLEMIRSHGLLETRVPGTGRDGGPNCATVKPFGGWQAARK